MLTVDTVLGQGGTYGHTDGLSDQATRLLELHMLCGTNNNNNKNNINRRHFCRSFVLYPLSLVIPGKEGEYRKLLGESRMAGGRPVYYHPVTGELIFYKGDLHRHLQPRSGPEPRLIFQTISGVTVLAVTIQQIWEGPAVSPPL